MKIFYQSFCVLGYEMMRLLHFGGRNWVRYGTCTDQGGFLLRRIIKDRLTHRYHACLMCAAQATPLKDAFPSSSSTPGTVYPQCRWVSTKAPLKQVAHIQTRRLLPTQRRLLPIPAYLRRDIVGHAVGAESGSLLTLWCWVSPANSSSSCAGISFLVN